MAVLHRLSAAAPQGGGFAGDSLYPAVPFGTAAHFGTAHSAHRLSSLAETHRAPAPSAASTSALSDSRPPAISGTGSSRLSRRSTMNVTFTSPNPDLDKKFCAEAAEAGFVNLKGHRLVGGMRASIYNAMPAEGVDKLVDFMEKFRKENA